MQSVYGQDGALLGRMTSYHQLKDGIPLKIVPIEIEEANAAMTALEPFLRSIGMSGPVNLQGRMTDEGPRFFEMNARFTGITGARALLGFNEVETLIRDALGLPLRLGSLAANHRRIAIRQVNDRAVDVARHSELREAAKLRGHRFATGQHVLVTGASGWLGRHLLHALSNNDRVGALTLITRDATRLKAMLPASSKPIEICEIPREGGLPLFPAGQIDLVYHLAGGRPIDTLESQAEGLRFGHLLALHLSRNSLSSFVNISSQSVYGTKKDPLWHEDTAVAPETPYAMSKWAGESFADLLRGAVPLNRVTSIRLARLYGAAEGLRWSELPHLFSQRAAASQPIVVKGGKQAYDLIHIRDAVAALMCFLDDKNRWQPVYNLGSGESTGITTIAEAALEAGVSLGLPSGSISILPGDDAMRTGMSTSRFTKDFSWKPVVSLREAMVELVSIARNQGQVRQ
jgi:nucleoside-diphosphate-sugar epimerase